jgi:mono/diheme cytochrome c family protein
MTASLEIKALGLALLTASISLGGVLLAAIPIKTLTDTGASEVETSSPSLEVATSPELIERGSQFFAMSCAHCHGDDAHGDEGPDLYNLPVSNAYISTMIKKGIKGEMPTFAKKYDKAQIAALVAYLRSLR